MRLLIIVATPDPDVERVILQRREGLVPAPARDQVSRFLHGARLSISCFLGQPSSTHESFVSHLKNLLTSEVQGVVIAIDRSISHLVGALQNVCFVFRYDSEKEIKSPANFFGAKFAAILANYVNFARRFDNAKDRKLLTLPLRNFDARELRDLRALCADPGGERRFAEDLDQQLKALRQRQKPKRYSDYEHVYIVDDQGKHFALGRERHARADTRQPPHNDICALGKDFRFGRRFDADAHFNVSMGREDQRMTGMYFDCHGDARSGERRTHLNMFANDFF